MSPDFAIWLNRLGLLMGFLSFWLAAPEIIGESRLHKIENSIERIFTVLPSAIKSWLQWDDKFSAKFVLNHIVRSFIASVVFMLPYYFYDLVIENPGQPELIRRIGFVYGILGGFALMTALTIIMFIGPRLVKFLKDDSQARRRWLWIGSILFALGTLLQFIATF